MGSTKNYMNNNESKCNNNVSNIHDKISITTSLTQETIDKNDITTKSNNNTPMLTIHNDISPIRKASDVVLKHQLPMHQKSETIRPLRVEELVRNVYEKKFGTRSIQYTQPFMESEKKQPEIITRIKKVEIDSLPPIFKTKTIHVPTVVTEEILVPKDPSNIIVIPEIIEKIIPNFKVHEIEKEIIKPKYIERKVPIIIEEEKPHYISTNFEDVDVKVAMRILTPIVKQSDTVVEIPIRRFIPKYIPVDIITPKGSPDYKKVIDILLPHIKCELIKEDVIPLSVDISDSCLLHRIASSGLTHTDAWNLTILSSGEVQLDTDSVVEKQEVFISAAHYNSWIQNLNSHLWEKSLQPSLEEYFKLDKDETIDEHITKILPYIRLPDGRVPLLPSNISLSSETNTLKSQRSHTTASTNSHSTVTAVHELPLQTTTTTENNCDKKQHYDIRRIVKQKKISNVNQSYSRLETKESNATFQSQQNSYHNVGLPPCVSTTTQSVKTS